MFEEHWSFQLSPRRALEFSTFSKEFNFFSRNTIPFFNCIEFFLFFLLLINFLFFFVNIHRLYILFVAFHTFFTVGQCWGGAVLTTHHVAQRQRG
jgi:hypothetical protein